MTIWTAKGGRYVIASKWTGWGPQMAGALIQIVGGSGKEASLTRSRGTLFVFFGAQAAPKFKPGKLKNLQPVDVMESLSPVTGVPCFFS